MRLWKPDSRLRCAALVARCNLMFLSASLILINSRATLPPVQCQRTLIGQTAALGRPLGGATGFVACRCGGRDRWGSPRSKAIVPLSRNGGRSRTEGSLWRRSGEQGDAGVAGGSMLVVVGLAKLWLGSGE